MGQPAPSQSVDRFGLDPRPPSPPPAFLRLPWWLRWPIGYTVAGVLYAGWAQAIVGETKRAEVAWFAVPYLATPMVVLVVLVVRSGRDGSALDTPRAFAWGATLSLVSIFLFTLGYAGWPLMIATTPAALVFFVQALTEPEPGRRFRAAVTSLAVVLLGLFIGVADLSVRETAVGGTSMISGVAHLAWLRQEARGRRRVSSRRCA